MCVDNTHRKLELVYSVGSLHVYQGEDGEGDDAHHAALQLVGVQTVHDGLEAVVLSQSGVSIESCLDQSGVSIHRPQPMRAHLHNDAAHGVVSAHDVLAHGQVGEEVLLV